MKTNLRRTLLAPAALVLCILCVLCGSPARAQQAASGLRTRHVVLIVLDGVRWQEVFTGAEKALIEARNSGMWDKKEDIEKEFWRDDVNARREALFPFLWGTVARQGQIFGNQTKGSVAHVSNGKAFSYPGYNEMLTGSPDSKIDSNEFGLNPNVTVFEWLNHQPEFQGKVAVFGTWSIFKDIFNEPRSKLIMQAGWDLPYDDAKLPREALLNDLYRTTTRLDDEDVYDSFLQIPLVDFLKVSRPRLLFVGYGEADNWAHAGRYDLVLHSAHEADRYIEQLWTMMQSNPEFRDSTTFLITADHGRGSGPKDWKEHGVKEKGSENIWLAVIGPDTQPLGERANVPPIVQAQIASTIAALLGQDYVKAQPRAAAPITAIYEGKK